MSELFQALMAIITWLMSLTIIPATRPPQIEPQPIENIVQQIETPTLLNIPPCPGGMLPTTEEWYWTGTEWKTRERPDLLNDYRRIE